MSKEVVYILGAGFSAPAGIPTMKTFIDRARQMKRGNPEYDYFDNVIRLIQETVYVGQYFAHDSGNIEQALSLIEMKDNLESTNAKSDLIRFIKEVIKGSTPPIPKFDIDKMPSNGWDFIFTLDRKWQGYCGFVASLANLEFREGTNFERRGLRAEFTEGKTNYSLISLNYDLLLENVISFFIDSYWWRQKEFLSFKKGAEHNGELFPSLLKLHGSVDTNNIIPPTYNKGLYGSELPQSWRDAFQLLHRANEIRVIGYSLPDTDSYIKYLLMASVDKLRDLDRVDWIVLDPDRQVYSRVEEFIKFPNKRFANVDAIGYLQSIFGYSVNKTLSQQNRIICFQHLEEAHDSFMESNKSTKPT